MYVLVDKNLRSIEIKNLQKEGFIVLQSIEIAGINNSTSTHPDIQLHFVDSNTAVCEPTALAYYQSQMPEHIQLIPGKNRCTSTYPKDIAYNVTRIGKHIFGNLKYTDSMVLHYYKQKSYFLHDVRQGYTKCNTCIVDDAHVITEDIGLHNIFMENKIVSLLISPGEVELEGYPNGFIGGASGKAENRIYFNGNLKKHPQGEIIEGFVRNTGKVPKSLSDNKLRDNGSMIFFD